MGNKHNKSKFANVFISIPSFNQFFSSSHFVVRLLETAKKKIYVNSVRKYFQEFHETFVFYSKW